MPDTDGPWLVEAICSSHVQIAAGVDGEIPEGLEFLRGGIDGESFGDGSEVRNQWAAECDRSAMRIELDVAPGGVRGGLDTEMNGGAAAMFAIEATRHHEMSGGGVECASGFFGDQKGEPNGL